MRVFLGLKPITRNFRVGAAIRIPHVDWVLHGFYGRYYQAPPLATVSGPLLDQVISQGFGFLPLRGERLEKIFEETR